MFPPPAVNGCVVPGGWMPWRQLRLGCHPPGLFDRLKALPSFEPRELALDMELEAKAIEGCADEEYADWIELHTRREQRWFEIAAAPARREEPADLVAVMFDGARQAPAPVLAVHRPGAAGPQQPDAVGAGDHRPLRGLLPRASTGSSRELVELAGPEPTVVLASDHGFGPTRDIFYVNAWLEQQGYLAWADERAGRATEGRHRRSASAR